MAPGRPKRSKLERGLGIITEVREGEGATALLLATNVFLLLMAYYFLKPVREGLLLPYPGAAEYKAYLNAGIALLLLGVVPLYGRVADRARRNRLVIGVTLFFVTHLVAFYLAAEWTQGDSSGLVVGLLFYVWIGIFNMMVVAQFWAFANDVYTVDQGHRLFALVNLGAALGGVAGSAIARAVIPILGQRSMMLVGGALLLLCTVLVEAVHVRESHHADARAPAAVDTRVDTPKRARAPTGAFALVRRHRYLSMIAAFTLIFTFVNTNGEYILSKAFKAGAAAAVAAGSIPDTTRAQGELIGSMYADFYLYVNGLVLVLQAFGVSRLLTRLGLGRTFLILPAVAFLDAIAILVAPILPVIRVGKTLENATDYSVNNTTRAMLWLPTTREMKYKAKQAVDTFFVRIGDVSSGLTVFVLAGLAGVHDLRVFAAVNAALVFVWISLALGIARENERLARHGAMPTPLSPTESPALRPHEALLRARSDTT